jgi:hypothetical protein
VPDTPAQNIRDAAARLRAQRATAARVSKDLAEQRDAERAAGMTSQAGNENPR